MNTLVKNWQEGEGSVTITYQGNGDGIITLSSDVNEGIDRSMNIRVGTKSTFKVLTLKQEGQREVLHLSDGSEFYVSNGRFQVLKNGIQ